MKQRKGIIIGIVLIVIIGLIIKNAYEAGSINKNGVYVIGKIEKIQGAYQGVRIFVSYKFKGKIIKNDYVNSNFDKKEVMVKKYFFKIDPFRLNKFHIEYKIPVPDSLLESPYNGWDSMPVKYDQIR